MPSPDDPGPRAAAWTALQGEERATAYDARWERLAASGRSVHGEADLVSSWLTGHDDGGAAVLDAGCGTGRVAIELARRGHRTVGLDRDVDLLATARTKAPELTWIEADLCDVGSHLAPGTLDLAVLAGNVVIFLDPGTEAVVLAAVARTLHPGGGLVAGFQVRPGGYGPSALDRDAARAGLELVARWSTWDRSPWTDGDDYQVSVHTVPHAADGPPL